MRNRSPISLRMLRYTNLALLPFFLLRLVCNFSVLLRTYIFCIWKDGEAYAYLLNALAPEHSTHATLDIKDPSERAKKVLEQAEKLDCKRYLSPQDIVEGSANLNLAFVAQLFQHRSLA